MKTHHPSFRILAAGFVVVLAAALPALHAGPGIDFWTRKGPPESANAAATPAPRACTGATTVGVFSLQNEFVNGKGPSRLVQTGTKQVCTSCAAPGTVMVPSWPNGKGPLVAQTVTGSHDCTALCPVQ